MNILLDSLILAWIEITSFFDILRSNLFKISEARVGWIVLKAALIQKVSNIIWDVVVASILEINQQYLLTSCFF